VAGIEADIQGLSVDDVDVVGAYYHETQNDFAASPANVKACATLPASKNNFCSGTVDAASAVIDRKFAPKWDTYIDTFFSQSNGGLNNGFFTRPVLPLLKVEPLSVAVRRDGPR
jgi:hypothetical protein